jgi:2,5-diketo-D-gluconate reductase A
VTAAVQAGYWHSDTAQRYGNEKKAGEAIARSSVDQADVFVTCKLGNGNQRPQRESRPAGTEPRSVGTDRESPSMVCR